MSAARGGGSGAARVGQGGELVVGVGTPACGTPESFAFGDTDEEVIGTQVICGDESQRLDGRRRDRGTRPTPGRAFKLLRGRRLGCVEFAGGRFEADALAVALGGLADFLGDAAALVVVVPEYAGCYHGSCLPVLHISIA